MVPALERSVLLRAVLRHRWIVLGLAALGTALLEVRTSGPSSDGWYFASAGRDLLSSHGLHVYASQALQAGPIQIGAFGLLAHVTDLLDLPADSTYAVISSLASIALVGAGVRLLRRYVGLPDSPLAELLTGTFAIGWLLVTEVYTSGHPAELVVPAMWIAAAVLATRGHAAWAGVLVGLGAGFETWALLGLPVLLFCGQWRPTARAVASAVTVVAALYLPFFIAGPFRMGHAIWNVAPTSFVHAVDPRLADLPWSGRLAQAAVVITLGVLAWSSGRRASGPVVAVWLVPAVIALAKAISEPAGYDWYWLPAQITLLAGCACADRLPRRVLAAAVLAEVVAVTTPLHRWPIALAALVGLLLVGWVPIGERPAEPARTLPSAA